MLHARCSAVFGAFQRLHRKPNGCQAGWARRALPQFGLDFLSFFVTTERILHGCRAVSKLFLPELNGLPNPRFIGVTYECWDS